MCHRCVCRVEETGAKQVRGVLCSVLHVVLFWFHCVCVDWFGGVIVCLYLEIVVIQFNGMFCKAICHVFSPGVRR